MSTQPIETRIARLEGAYEQIDKRLGSIDGRMASLEHRMTALEQKTDHHFLWLLGVLVVSVILPIASHFAAHESFASLSSVTRLSINTSPLHLREAPTL
jgi:hypothetical protein